MRMIHKKRCLLPLWMMPLSLLLCSCAAPNRLIVFPGEELLLK